MNKTGAPKIEVNEDELPVDAIELLRKCGQSVERFTCVNIDRESHYYRTQEAAQAALLNNQVNYRS